MSSDIWCFLVGDVNIFPVPYEAVTVGRLKDKIKEKTQALKDVGAHHLTLYRVEVNNSYNEPNLVNYLNQLAQTLDMGNPLDPRTPLSEIWIEAPQGNSYYIVIQAPEIPTATRSQHVQGVVGNYIEEVVFHTGQTGTDHINGGTLEGNQIHKGTRHHLAHQQILQRLTKRRPISQEHRDRLRRRFLERDFSNGVDDYFEVTGNIDGTCSEDEVNHYFTLCDGRESPLDKDHAKYKATNPFFDQIARYLRDSYGDRAMFTREGCWPLKFVAQVGSGRFSYEPRSDYLFSLDTCPQINIEISTRENQRDRYRMLLQAGLLVRVVNKLAFPTRNPFVVIAIYITKGFTAEWYLVYQVEPSNKKIVYFKDGEFNLGTPLGRFQFFHRLYNIPFALSDDGDELPTIEEDLSTQKELVENQRYKGFTGRTKRRTRSNTPPSGNNPMEIDNLPTDQMFVNAEYEVLPENKLEEGWAPLDPLPSTVRCARGPGNKRVILKIVEPDEFKIHSFLASIRSPDNHTIPILCDIPRGVEKLIATQQETVLSAALSQLPKTKRHLLACQFLEGVHFMHENHVAHLDLKPDNIVVATPTNRLFIIDFGVSARVSGLESRIKGYRGTEGWAAPEIEANSDTGYQPIQADLWSAGQVLKYFADHQPAHTGSIIYPLAERLMNCNPKLRPSLSMILKQPIFKPKKKHNADPLKKEELNPVQIVVPDSPNNYYRIPGQGLVDL